jgi:AbrB family looped-hinge helix DNA binding protein
VEGFIKPTGLKMCGGDLHLKIAEIVRVDSKGRITIPMVVREALDIVEGMNLILVADTEKREIVVSPLPSETTSLYELYLEIKDVPGALAKVSEKIAEHNIDQITTQCTVLKRGELAECVIVIDMSKAKVDIESLRHELIELPEVQLVNVRLLKR